MRKIRPGAKAASASARLCIIHAREMTLFGGSGNTVKQKHLFLSSLVCCSKATADVKAHRFPLKFTAKNQSEKSEKQKEA